jgi:hypothetical protein
MLILRAKLFHFEIKQFEKKQYRRVIEEDATEFRPQFYIKVICFLLSDGANSITLLNQC